MKKTKEECVKQMGLGTKADRLASGRMTKQHSRRASLFESGDGLNEVLEELSK